MSAEQWLCIRRQHERPVMYLTELTLISEAHCTVSLTTDIRRAYRWEDLPHAEAACRLAATLTGGVWLALPAATAERSARAAARPSAA